LRTPCTVPQTSYCTRSGANAVSQPEDDLCLRRAQFDSSLQNRDVGSIQSEGRCGMDPEARGVVFARDNSRWSEPHCVGLLGGRIGHLVIPRQLIELSVISDPCVSDGLTKVKWPEVSLPVAARLPVPECSSGRGERVLPLAARGTAYSSPR